MSDPVATSPGAAETASAATRSGRSPSMADVAREVGVSHQTVSRVLNDSPLVSPVTRERVLAAIEVMGYRRNGAARALATRRSRCIGVVTAHLSERGPAMIASSLLDAAHDAGYGVALVGLQTFNAEAFGDAVDRLVEQSVDAIVVSVTHQEVSRLARNLKLHIPVVLAEGVVDIQPLAAGVAQREGGLLATSHLLGLGHTSVAHVAGPLDWVEAVERRSGWLEAHARAGVEPGPQWTGDWTPASGYDAGVQAAAQPGLSAMFVANDQMALGVLLALNEAGLQVPEDVSVVGFDDLPESAYFSPPLTTVRQDFPELARRAVHLALRALGDEDAPASPLLSPRLVQRRSTAPAAGITVRPHAE